MQARIQPKREFPALLMTLLVIGASLASTGCLRKMTEATTLPSPSYLTDDVQYYAPATKLASAIRQVELQDQLRQQQELFAQDQTN